MNSQSFTVANRSRQKNVDIKAIFSAKRPSKLTTLKKRHSSARRKLTKLKLLAPRSLIVAKRVKHASVPSLVYKQQPYNPRGHHCSCVHHIDFLEVKSRSFPITAVSNGTLQQQESGAKVLHNDLKDPINFDCSIHELGALNSVRNYGSSISAIQTNMSSRNAENSFYDLHLSLASTAQEDDFCAFYRDLIFGGFLERRQRRHLNDVTAGSRATGNFKFDRRKVVEELHLSFLDETATSSHYRCIGKFQKGSVDYTVRLYLTSPTFFSSLGAPKGYRILLVHDGKVIGDSNSPVHACCSEQAGSGNGRIPQNQSWLAYDIFADHKNASSCLVNSSRSFSRISDSVSRSVGLERSVSRLSFLHNKHTGTICKHCFSSTCHHIQSVLTNERTYHLLSVRQAGNFASQIEGLKYDLHRTEREIRDTSATQLKPQVHECHDRLEKEWNQVLSLSDQMHVVKLKEMLAGNAIAQRNCDDKRLGNSIDLKPEYVAYYEVDRLLIEEQPLVTSEKRVDSNLAVGGAFTNHERVGFRDRVQSWSDEVKQSSMLSRASNNNDLSGSSPSFLYDSDYDDASYLRSCISHRHEDEHSCLQDSSKSSRNWTDSKAVAFATPPDGTSTPCEVLNGSFSEGHRRRSLLRSISELATVFEAEETRSPPSAPSSPTNVSTTSTVADETCCGPNPNLGHDLTEEATSASMEVTLTSHIELPVKTCELEHCVMDAGFDNGFQLGMLAHNPSSYDLPRDPSSEQGAAPNSVSLSSQNCGIPIQYGDLTLTKMRVLAEKHQALKKLAIQAENHYDGIRELRKSKAMVENYQQTKAESSKDEGCPETLPSSFSSTSSLEEFGTSEEGHVAKETNAPRKSDATEVTELRDNTNFIENLTSKVERSQVMYDFLRDLRNLSIQHMLSVPNEFSYFNKPPGPSTWLDGELAKRERRGFKQAVAKDLSGNYQTQDISASPTTRGSADAVIKEPLPAAEKPKNSSRKLEHPERHLQSQVPSPPSERGSKACRGFVRRHCKAKSSSLERTGPTKMYVVAHAPSMHAHDRRQVCEEKLNSDFDKKGEQVVQNLHRPSIYRTQHRGLLTHSGKTAAKVSPTRSEVQSHHPSPSSKRLLDARARRRPLRRGRPAEPSEIRNSSQTCPISTPGTRRQPNVSFPTIV